MITRLLCKSTILFKTFQKQLKKYINITIRRIDITKKINLIFTSDIICQDGFYICGIIKY